MGTPADLDISVLLAPFDGESPGGVDLRQDADPNNDFRVIKDLRNDAAEQERQADLRGEPSASPVIRSIWRDVWSKGHEFLATQAKDLEIVAYMIEAAVRLHGFSGLARALNLTTKMIQDFWGELLPAPDEDGVSTTLLPISRLDGKTITYALQRVPITEETPSTDVLVVWQHDQGKRLETQSSDERETQIARGAITLDAIRTAVALTVDQSPDFYRDLVSDIKQAAAALTALTDTLENKTATLEDPQHLDEQLVFSHFPRGIQTALETIEQIAGEHIHIPEDLTESDVEPENTEQLGQSSGGAPIRGKIGSREEAFSLLETVAVWFEKHEPQSILPAEIRKAQRRGRLSPQELYADLIADQEVLSRVFKDVGIDIPENSEE